MKTEIIRDIFFSILFGGITLWLIFSEPEYEPKVGRFITSTRTNTSFYITRVFPDQICILQNSWPNGDVFENCKDKKYILGYMDIYDAKVTLKYHKKERN